MRYICINFKECNYPNLSVRHLRHERLIKFLQQWMEFPLSQTITHPSTDTVKNNDPTSSYHQGDERNYKLKLIKYLCYSIVFRFHSVFESYDTSAVVNSRCRKCAKALYGLSHISDIRAVMPSNHKTWGSLIKFLSSLIDISLSWSSAEAALLNISATSTEVTVFINPRRIVSGY